MNVELVILGLIFDIVGVFILTLMAITNYHHQKNLIEKWYRRYWWFAWRPLLRISPDSEKPYWKIYWKHVRSVHGPIPPKHMMNIIGFTFVLIGFILQIKSYI